MGSGQTPTPSVHVQTKTVSTAISAGRMATAMATGTATATATDPGVNATFARTRKRCSMENASLAERAQPSLAQCLALEISAGDA